MFEFTKRLTLKECNEYPKKIFVFGDNVRRQGRAGQAVIRRNPNTFGIPTKYEPTMEEVAFFSDKPREVDMIEGGFEYLMKKHEHGITVVLPVNPIGSGLAELPDRAPVCYTLITDFWSYAKKEIDRN